MRRPSRYRFPAPRSPRLSRTHRTVAMSLILRFQDQVEAAEPAPARAAAAAGVRRGGGRRRRSQLLRHVGRLRAAVAVRLPRHGRGRRHLPQRDVRARLPAVGDRALVFCFQRKTFEENVRTKRLADAVNSQIIM